MKKKTEIFVRFKQSELAGEIVHVCIYSISYENESERIYSLIRKTRVADAWFQIYAI